MHPAREALFNRLKLALEKHVPEAALTTVVNWLIDYKVVLTITRQRHSKYGDYRHPTKQHGHRISVNGTLNPYFFLITFVHEVAHLTAWLKHKNNVAPHGNEWKKEFQILMLPLLEKKFLPQEIQSALARYLLNPAASSCADENLTRILMKYDIRKSITVEEIPSDTLFKIHNGRIFRKGERIRKRYKCQEIRTKQFYLFSPVADVEIVEQV